MIAILAAGWALAWYQYVITHSDKSTTSTNSSVQVQNFATIEGTWDLEATRLYGAETIDIQNGYLNDNGQQTIFLGKNTTWEQTSNAILQRIKNPQQNNDAETIKIKQATIQSQGDTIIIRNGGALEPYLAQNDIEITLSGNDLIVQPNHPTSGSTNSILLVKNTNPTNYTIADNNDWFSQGIFMISKNEFTIIRITWNNNIERGQYVFRKDKSYSEIPLSQGIRSRYSSNSYMWNGNLAWETTNLPAETSFAFAQEYADPLSNPTVYLVTFWQEKTKNNDFFSSVKENSNEWVSNQLEAMLSTAEKNITQFSQLENKGGEFAFKTTKNPEQWIVIINKWFAQIFPIKTNTPFSATLRDASNDRNPYVKSITSTHPLDDSSLKKSLTTILGSGGWQDDWSYGNNFAFSYKIQPKKTYKGDLVITSIFGDTTKIPLSLYIETISPKVVEEHILSNDTVNILPNDGSFQDVLIQTKNKPNTTVEFQACSIDTKVDTAKRQGEWLENNIFNCTWTVYPKEVSIKDFVYRKTYRTAVSLPDDFPKKTPAFKVSIPWAGNNRWMKMNTTQYFYKSNIGIWAKVAKDSVYVWWFMFSDNAPITQWTITIKELNGKEIAKQKITSSSTKISFHEQSKPMLVELSAWDETSFVIIAPNGQNYFYANDKSRKINSFLDPSDVVNNSANISFRWSDEPQKIYWYTDKSLYKAGENIYFAGFARDLTDFSSLGYLSGKTVSVTINDTQGNQIYSKDNIPLDSFGGFQWTAPIPTKLSLGDAIINYTLSESQNITFSQNIKIKEYQKPTFFADITYENKDGNTNLIIKPKYYFGQDLKEYDAKITRSLAGKNSCFYCRRENDEKYYYNTVFNDTISTWWDMALYKEVWNTSLPLFSESLLMQKWYQYTLKATVIIRDKTSDEVQFFTKYIDFAPAVKLGLSGQPFDRLYNDGWKDTRKWYEINGEVAEWKWSIKNITYEVYYYSYEQTTEQGVDGSVYYLNGTEYTKLLSKDIGTSSSFSIKTDFIQKPGMYFVRVFAEDKNGTIIGEVQKEIDYYDSTQGSDGMLGSLPNNYALNVSIPKKTYEEWEKIPVDIEPYQKGARVILTVERWDSILETIEKTLDGSQLTIEAKKWYAPNIVVNVMQIVWTDKATWPRKEPRFFAGFAQAEISTAMHELQIELKTDKETYKPWEKVELTITTKDSKGKSVDARISVGVVDKSLLNLYDIIKEPIPYFFNKLGTNIKNFTNMKLLYQSLKAFANNGSKWWGGNGGQGMFSMIRDDLSDVAFRRWGVIVTWGKTTLTFDLPDNITTWTIDAIGITKDTRLWTTRKDIIATKKLVLEPTPPLFLTLGDKIEIPVKVIVSPEIAWKAKKVTGTTQIKNDAGEVIDLGKFSSQPNSRLIVPVKIPDSWANSHFMKLIIAGEFANEEDGVEVTIPIRAEWLVAKDSVWFINSAWKHIFTLPAFRYAQSAISLSTLPTNLIDPIIDNTFVRVKNYPLTEQLASQVAVLSLTKQLADKGAFQSSLLHNDTITTIEWEQNINTLINDSIAQIIKRQMTDGSVTWRDDQNNTSTPEDRYLLSAYTYGVLVHARGNYEAKDQLDRTINELWDFLMNYRTVSESAFLRYLTQKSQVWKTFSESEKTTLNSMNPLKIPYGWVLRYTIAVYQEDSDNMKKWKQYAIVPTNEERSENSIFINQTTALLLKTSALFKDPTSTQPERMEWLQNMIKLRNKAGNRWTSNANAQALITLSQLNETNRPTKEKVSCEVTIDGKKHNVSVTSSGSIITQEIKKTTSETTWSCDNPIVADLITTFLATDLNKLAGAAQHVNQMKYTIVNSTAKIGDTTDLVASFTTDLAGEKIGINIYIPATFKLVDTIQAQGRSSIFGQSRWEYDYGFGTQLPFKLSDYGCTPNHWEINYDKLFLYYDSLPPITCDVSIPLLKAYNGNTTIMPMSVSEIYKWTVNGRKVITQ